jgi:hypothetical protein
LLSPLTTSFFLHVWGNSYWTFGINIGNLLEPSLCHHEVWVLDVGSDFLSLVHVQLLKDVAVNSRRVFFVSSRVNSNWSCMWGYSWDGSLLPTSSWKFPICTASHWLIYSKMRKRPRTSLSSFMFSQQGLGSISLQEAPGVAIVFWQSQSYLSFWSLTLVLPILRIQQPYSLTSVKLSIQTC